MFSTSEGHVGTFRFVLHSQGLCMVCVPCLIIRTQGRHQPQTGGRQKQKLVFPCNKPRSRSVWLQCPAEQPSLKVSCFGFLHFCHIRLREATAVKGAPCPLLHLLRTQYGRSPLSRWPGWLYGLRLEFWLQRLCAWAKAMDSWFSLAPLIMFPQGNFFLCLVTSDQAKEMLHTLRLDRTFSVLASFHLQWLQLVELPCVQFLQMRQSH